MSASAYLDPKNPQFRIDPYPLFAELREAAPIHWSPALKGWVTLRYETVRHVLSNPTHSVDSFTPYYEALPSDYQIQSRSLLRFLGNWLVFIDPPRHTRLRRLTAKVFTTRALQSIRPNVERIVDHLLSTMDDRDELDLVSAFSNPLPAYVIMDMLGVPRSMLPDMKAWSDEIKLFIGVALAAEDKYARAVHGVEAMADAFRDLIRQHRAAPRDNVLSLLIAARDDVDGGQLTDDELIATAILFLFAGHETTTNLVSMASLAIMTDDALRQRFLALSSDDAIEAAVEEFLRHDGPTPVMMRVAVTEHELGGQPIAAGDRVFPVIASANRDPGTFATPDAIDFARTPNRHLTFGYGTHFCLGAPLARMEAQIALPALHNRFPNMALGGEIAWADGMTLRGPTALPVRLNA
jgi:cytochrome P450